MAVLPLLSGPLTGGKAPFSLSSAMLSVMDITLGHSPREALHSIPGVFIHRNSSEKLPRRKTPEEQLHHAKELRDLLLRDDGTLRGGTIRKVLVHVAFALSDIDLIDCFLHGYRCEKKISVFYTDTA